MDRSLYKRLGDYILPTMEKNVGLKVHLSQGISNNKYFQDPRQVAQDSENDQIVRRGQFAFNKATTRNGEKISIAYREGEDCTVSSAYQVFYIKDEEQLNPHYLMMWFNRPEFDRYARFKSHGSAHEFFTFEEMCNVLLPVPSIEEQRRIVAEYQTVEHRIKNNEAFIQKLEETAQAIYRHTFVEGIDETNLPEGWRMGSLGDICDISNGKLKEPTNGAVPIYGGNGIVGYCEEYNATNIIVIGRVGVNCGCLYLEEDNCWVNDNAMKGTSLCGSLLFAYYHMNALQINRFSGGSSQPLVTQTLLNQIPCIVPNKNSITEFDRKVKVIRNQIKLIEHENSQLHALLSLLTSKLA